MFKLPLSGVPHNTRSIKTPIAATTAAFIVLRQLSMWAAAPVITCTCVTVTKAPFELTGGAEVTTTADVVVTITAPGVVTVLKLVKHPHGVVDQVAQDVEVCCTAL